MFKSTSKGKRSIELDYVDELKFKPNFKQASQLLLSPHQVSLLDKPASYLPTNIGCNSVQTDCTCISKKKNNIFERLKLTNISHLVWVDPVGLPLTCISSILLDWKRYTNDSARNIGLGFIIRTSDKPISETGNFSLSTESGEINLSKERNPNYLWMPSIEFQSEVLTKEGERLKPYDVYPLVDFTNGSFFVSNHGIMENVQFLEYFGTRTRNFIYLDVSRPDFIFRRLSETIKSLLKSDFVVLNPVISPGGDQRSYFAEVCAAVLNDAWLYTDLKYVPFNSDMKLNGYIILRNRI